MMDILNNSRLISWEKKNDFFLVKSVSGSYTLLRKDKIILMEFQDDKVLIRMLEGVIVTAELNELFTGA